MILFSDDALVRPLERRELSLESRCRRPAEIVILAEEVDLLVRPRGELREVDGEQGAVHLGVDRAAERRVEKLLTGELDGLARGSEEDLLVLRRDLRGRFPHGRSESGEEVDLLRKDQVVGAPRGDI